ncbi:MAG: CoA activase [Synergistaceae bacterium]|nr:CoA activase [Synergistaceae bacterium]MBR0079193.1 CoA activase [Synergistaceae bacterium]MBR0252919.1 CoA activase [Synergistaceae bacterium]
MFYAGIDIGSTAAKAVLLDESKTEILARKLMPSGWNSKETANEILSWLISLGHERNEIKITATGYGRVSVPDADSTLTEITCHGKGAAFLGGNDLTVIDIGGQDTKVIILKNGRVIDFVMNDKCSAGTGKFLEVMANRMGVSLPEFFSLAEHGRDIKISSMCTVFAESEIVSLMGLGTPREDIACGAVGSVASKVSTLVSKKNSSGQNYYLTGGFCESPFLIRKLSEILGAEVSTNPDARFAGAIGAALLGK